MQGILKNSFHKEILRINLCLRRQTLLRAGMHSACPSVFEMRRAFLGHAVNWLSIYLEELNAYMNEEDAKAATDDVWWVITVAVRAFTRA